MPLKFIPTNVKYNDSGEFKNISIPADRAYIGEVITVSSTQPTNSDNKLWINTNEQTKQTYQIPTVSESLALGINNASVGDIIRVSGIDSLGKPTSWQHVSLNEIICNKNLLDNWYFVGGGSQLGYGKFPINQRGQTSYSGAVFCIDRWKVSGAGHDVVVGSDYITYTRTALTGNPYLSQTVTVPFDGTYTFSALYRTSKSCFGLNGNNRFPVSADWNLHSVTVSLTAGANAFHVIQDYGAADGAAEVGDHIDIKAVKLELGAYQTLVHNEGTESNPNWVLNDLPDYDIELLKAQKYLQIIPASGTFLVPIGYGIGYDTTQIRVTVSLPTPMVKTPTVTVQNCSVRFYQDSLSAAITTYTAVTATSGSSGNEHLRPYVMLRFTVTGALNAKVAEVVIIGDSGSTNPGILLSAED